MILHLLPKDEKFIDYVIDYFEEIAPEENKFLIAGTEINPPFKHVKNKGKFNYALEYSKEYFELLGDLNNYQAVITHGLDVFRSSFVHKIPSQIKVAWIIFGGEVYNCFPVFSDHLYFPKTDQLQFSLGRSKKYFFKNLVGQKLYSKTRFILYSLFAKDRLLENTMIKGMKRADYIGVVIKEDYESFSTKLSLQGKWGWFTYYNIEDTVSLELYNEQVRGNNILIGNSSSATNNHFEILEYLGTQELKDRKVIVPLGYGDLRYQEKIIENGNKILVNNFQPLTEFMPRESYNKTLLDCNIAIMNHRRQQAVGTILTLLWLGVRVFLNEENNVFTYLKRIGINVFSIRKDLIEEGLNSFSSLSLDKIQHNRRILKEEFSKEVVLKRNKEFLIKLINN